MGIPRTSDLFTTNDPVEIVDSLDKYKNDLNKAYQNPMPVGMTGENSRMYKAVRDSKTLNKALSTDAISSVQREMAFIGKDLDLAGPGTTGGLHAYDLEAPAKNLVPLQTPLRNRIARKRGIGTAHEFKRILGYTGSETGGVPLIHPLQAEDATTAWGTQNYLRGARISYAGDAVSVPFRKFSVSDRVSWDATFAGEGFQDLRQLSATSALYSGMLLEERMLLGGRGTAAGFSGALATPSAPTVSTPAASGGQDAVTGVTTNVYVKISATTVWGETAASAAGNSAFTTGDVVTISWAHVEGATGYRIYVGSGSSLPADNALWLQTSTAANTITLTGAVKTSGSFTVAAPRSTGPTANDSYDGILAYVLDPDRSGYLNYVNGPLTSDLVFQDAFATMFDANAADPESVLCNGHDRSALSELLKGQSSTNYQIMIGNGQDGVVGQMVTGISNQVTGTMVNLEVHRFMPRGVMPIMSWNLPLPDSNVSECWSIVNTADYQAINWPVTEFAYDTSVYWMGTFCAYAPEWSGAIAGIAS